MEGGRAPALTPPALLLSPGKEGVPLIQEDHCKVAYPLHSSWDRNSGWFSVVGFRKVIAQTLKCFLTKPPLSSI